MQRYFLIFATVALAFAFGAAAQAQTEDGFEKIFNGENLEGWSGDPRLWSVEDGAIVGTTDDADKKIEKNTSLFYTKDQKLGDFVIKFDYKISKDGNSGMFYRCWFLDGPEKWRLGGYQADFNGDAQYAGIMYGEMFRGILANLGTVSKVTKDGKIVEIARFATPEQIREKIKIEDWNHYEVYAEGFTFVHKINGQVTSVFIDEDAVRRADGVLGWQLHVGPPMRVEYKNIYLKKL